MQWKVWSTSEPDEEIFIEADSVDQALQMAREINSECDAVQVQEAYQPK